MLTDMLNLTLFLKITSPAHGQSYDWSSAREVILKDIGKISRYTTTIKRSKIRYVCMIIVTYISVPDKVNLQNRTSFQALTPGNI